MKAPKPTIARWKRLSDALRRRRQDGRFPQPIAELIKSWVRLRARDIGDSVSAIVRRPWTGVRGELERSQGRKWKVAGDVPCSLHDLAHSFAERLVSLLRDTGLQPFLIEADGWRLCFGLALDQRSTAFSALESLSGEAGWYVDWRRGNRYGTVLLQGRVPSVLLQAEWWRLYSVYRAGRHYLAGRDQAVELSFWAASANDLMERTGIRGHHRYPATAAYTTENIDGREYPGLNAFPVGQSLTRFLEPIDVVYTWVDGDDPGWQQQLEH